MAKDLTNSKLDRQNILNNKLAIEAIQDKLFIDGILWKDKLYITREMAANFFDVDDQTISYYLEQYSEELFTNGYEELSDKKLKSFISAAKESGKDITVPIKTTVLGVFNFKAFLNLAMLLSECGKARTLRQLILDIVIDIINQKTGGGTKYINQPDKNFIFSSTQKDDSKKQFMDALKKYVRDNRDTYSHFTNLIYISIFKEKAKEYKKILDLKANDKVRDPFYSEILDIIAEYESGLADEIKKEYEHVGHMLTQAETEDVFNRLENMILWKPLIQRANIKMSNRNMALQDTFHYQLSENIQIPDNDEYQKFLDTASDELEQLMQENQDVLIRLKERD